MDEINWWKPREKEFNRNVRGESNLLADFTETSAWIMRLSCKVQAIGMLV